MIVEAVGLLCLVATVAAGGTWIALAAPGASPLPFALAGVSSLWIGLQLSLAIALALGARGGRPTASSKLHGGGVEGVAPGA